MEDDSQDCPGRNVSIWLPGSMIGEMLDCAERIARKTSRKPSEVMRIILQRELPRYEQDPTMLVAPPE